MLSAGQSGKYQVRDKLALGREWREVYGPFSPFSIEGRELIGRIHRAWRTGETVTLQHLLYPTPVGGGTGSPTVNGAGQTGTSLNTANWTGANPVLRIGDIFTVAGVPYVLECTDVATNLSSGQSTLTISPPIYASVSPANGAAITYVNPTLTARIIQEPDVPNVDSDGLITGLVIVFKEAV